MKRIISVLLIICLTLSLSACGGDSSSQGFGNDSTNSNTPDSYENIQFNKKDFDDSEFFSSTVFKADGNTYSNVKLSAAAASSFIEFVQSLNTSYTYSNIYKLEEALKKYRELPSFEDISHNCTLSEITPQALFDQVKINNKSYKENMPSYTSEFYSEFNDQELYKYCTIVAQTVNYYLEKGIIYDTERVKCILSDITSI